MNIQILDSWLREYLITQATPKQIAEKLSLCGPSVEKIQKYENDWLYDIEITTNRVDMMSVYGIAREASAILKQFGIKANLKRYSFGTPKIPSKSLPLTIKSDKNLIYRTMGVILTDIKNWQSPGWMATRLNASGIRSLNSVVDITNYVMTELGHPMHVFDYDKIPKSTIIIRESKKGEKIVSLENKEYSLAGGDIVFQATNGAIIDLPGIIGTKNSVVSNNTKRVLFFIDNNDPVRIRKSSMSLAIRTVAANLNEKGVDPELGKVSMLRAIELAQKITKARVASKIYDNYVLVNKPKTVETTHEFIENRLGIKVDKARISSILNSLEFGSEWSGKKLAVKVPSYRARDISLPEDIVEEIARIYGYHNIPSILMGGKIPDPPENTPFEFEMKIKQSLKSLGGIEVYTLSLVSKQDVAIGSLKLTNPLGADSEYLRTTLAPSLIKAASQNLGEREPYHLFEMANIYKPQKGNLPEEKMTLGGVFSNYEYREAKGVIEGLLDELRLEYQLVQSDQSLFLPSRGLVVECHGEIVGKFGITINVNIIYYEFEIEKLRKNYKNVSLYKPIPKYPPQIEDITFTLPEKTRVGDIISLIVSVDKSTNSVELTDIYKNSYTFRIYYQDPDKTLNNEDVKTIRENFLKKLKKVGVAQKN